MPKESVESTMVDTVTAGYRGASKRVRNPMASKSDLDSMNWAAMRQ